MKLYVVEKLVAYEGGNVVGVFDSKEQADEVARLIETEKPYYAEITEVTLNEVQ